VIRTQFRCQAVRNYTRKRRAWKEADTNKQNLKARPLWDVCEERTTDRPIAKRQKLRQKITIATKLEKLKVLTR
jgi:hypothetical protein